MKKVKITKDCEFKGNRHEAGKTYEFEDKIADKVAEEGYGEIVEEEEPPEITVDEESGKIQAKTPEETEDLGEVDSKATQRREKPESSKGVDEEVKQSAETGSEQRAVLAEGREVEVGDERMMVYEEEGVTKVRNLEKDEEYEILPLAPHCECTDFQIRVKEKGEKERCKHLEAAEKAGLNVGKFKAQTKVDVDLEEFSLNKPSKFIESEEQAKAIIRQIIGQDPEKEDVISSFDTTRGKVEVLSADVVISLARSLGIRTKVVDRDLQRFELTPEMVKKIAKDKWSSVAENMPVQEVVSTARITAVSGWLDESGNPQIGIGTKNEIMTPNSLRDTVNRGSNFIETTAETKAMKKSIINSLNVTENGLLRKIKDEYGWR